MARSFLEDSLQVHRFHLWDIDPSLSLPPFALNPAFGFSSCTLPEVTLNTETIKSGTKLFPRQVITGGSLSNLVAVKPATPFNSDFFKWVMSCAVGIPQSPKRELNPAKFFTMNSRRRNMLLIQFTTISMEGLKGVTMEGLKGVTMEGLKGVKLKPNGTFTNGKNALKAAALFPLGGVVSVFSKITDAIGIDLGLKYIPAKCWILFKCQPIRYKGASDFDATSSAISFQEIEFSVEDFDEITPTLF